MATNAKYVAGSRTDSTKVSSGARAHLPAADENDYSDVDGNVLVGAVGDNRASAPYGTYASSGRTTLTSNGDGRATHMLIQQGGGRQRSAYSDSDTEGGLDNGKRRTGPCRCCSRTCIGLWIIAVLVLLGFALAVASVVMCSFLVRDHLQQAAKQQAQQNLNTFYDQLVDNLRRAANSGKAPNGGVLNAGVLSATADFFPHSSATTSTPVPLTTTTEDSHVIALRMEEEAAARSTTPASATTVGSTDATSLAGVLSVADLTNIHTASPSTSVKPAVPAVGALRLPEPDPKDHVAADQTSYAARISMGDVPDASKS